ncbi:MAG: hypothetical protein II888_02890 [Clostridia bacterium]|nr:hypothetical protein [Clostridia bacterium]
MLKERIFSDGKDADSAFRIRREGKFWAEREEKRTKPAKPFENIDFSLKKVCVIAYDVL